MKISTLLPYLYLAVAANAASPYAPTAVGTEDDDKQFGSISYDTASNRLTNSPTTGPAQVITMGLLSKPVAIQVGDKIETYKHGLGGINSRPYLRHADGRNTLYLNGMEYRIPKPGDTSAPQYVVQIRAKNYSPDIQVDVTDSSNPQYIYFVKDHLGSPVCSVSNTALQRTRFDPWGAVTSATGIEQDLSASQAVRESAEKTRGFTGHETIAFANLINFNARFYDKNTGFLGPDRFIQGRSIVSLNRFIYVNNNVLNATDPNGWMRVRIEGLGYRPRDLRLRYRTREAFRQARMHLDRNSTITFSNIHYVPNSNANVIGFEVRIALNDTMASSYLEYDISTLISRNQFTRDIQFLEGGRQARGDVRQESLEGSSVSNEDRYRISGRQDFGEGRGRQHLVSEPESESGSGSEPESVHANPFSLRSQSPPDSSHGSLGTPDSNASMRTIIPDDDSSISSGNSWHRQYTERLNRLHPEK